MSNPNPLDGAKEIQEMLVTYARQETVDPLKALGRYLGFGLAGAVAIFAGTFFLALGVLRLLQSQGDALAGGSFASTVPYLVTLAVLLVAIGLLYILFSRARKKVQP